MVEVIDRFGTEVLPHRSWLIRILLNIERILSDILHRATEK